MKNKLLIKFDNLVKKIFGEKFIKLYVILSQILIIAYTIILEVNLAFLFLIIYLTMFIIYAFMNSKKKVDQRILDEDGVIPIEPFFGLPVVQLFSNPDFALGKSSDLPPVPIALLCWLSTCIEVIGRSKLEKYHYHSHLLESLEENGLTELFPWVDYLYEIHGIKKPLVNLPENLSAEDFE